MQHLLTSLLILTTFNIMAQKQIKTSIEIEAAPEKIWQELMDFKSYDSWNPFLTQMEGTFKE
jgi:hypothetical protein